MTAARYPKVAGPVQIRNCFGGRTFYFPFNIFHAYQFRNSRNSPNDKQIIAIRAFPPSNGYRSGRRARNTRFSESCAENALLSGQRLNENRSIPTVHNNKTGGLNISRFRARVTIKRPGRNARRIRRSPVPVEYRDRRVCPRYGPDVHNPKNRQTPPERNNNTRDVFGDRTARLVDTHGIGRFE